ncbi:MAG: hypothetical protein ACJ74H_17260 [Thermoanaerobaculia bacterium]
MLLLFSISVIAQSRTFELRRGIIVDGGREAVYIPQPDGAIEAVDLSAGRVLWTYADAALPLTVDGTLLVAQGEEKRPGRLPIAILDLQAGGRKVVDAVIPLPDDVHAMIADDFDRSFRATAQREGDAFLISWTYKEMVVQGIARAPEEPLPTRIVSGAARVQIATGRVIASPSVAPRVSTDAAAERVKAIHGLPEMPIQTGNVVALTQGGRGEKLTLKRWDIRTAAALPDRELSQRAIVALPSAERKYVLASERVGEGGPQDPEYRWQIFSLESGQRVGELRRDVSAAPFFIHGDNVIYESRPYGYRVGEVWVDEPLKIRALRLSQGGQVWDRPVRHLEYRGEVPPVR